jgi:hypothetical protein
MNVVRTASRGAIALLTANVAGGIYGGQSVVIMAAEFGLRR